MTDRELEELKRWTRLVTRGQKESASFMSLWNDKMATDPAGDPIPVMQLGYAMLLNKPIIVVAPVGSIIPSNVLKVAVAVEYFHEGDVASAQDATRRALTKAGILKQ